MSGIEMTETRIAGGPFLLADTLTYVYTNDSDFAAVVRWSFQDLLPVTGEATDGPTVRFDVLLRHGPEPIWGVWRDRELCEETDQAGYVLFHLQWEFNRVVLERRDATIHAAAVEVDGRCLIFSGSSMSGKTTLAGWMVAHGARYIADEIVALRPDGQAMPYRRPLGLRHGGPLEPHFTHPGNFDRRFDTYEMLVPVSCLGSGEMTDGVVPVGGIVFPVYSPETPTALDPLPKAVALERLCNNSPGLARHGRSVFRLFADLVSRVRTVELRTSDLYQARDMLNELLRESVEHSDG